MLAQQVDQYNQHEEERRIAMEGMIHQIGHFDSRITELRQENVMLLELTIARDEVSRLKKLPMVIQQATNDQMEKLSNNSEQSDIESKSKKLTEAETERCEYGAAKVNVIASNVSDKQGRERIWDESQPYKETVKVNVIEEESIDEPLSMEIDYKTQFEDDAQSLEIEKEINSKAVFYFKNGHKCWELRHLQNIKEAHEELNGDRSAIVDNTLTSAISYVHQGI